MNIPLSTIQRRSHWDQVLFPHELRVTTQASGLIKFNPTLYLEDLRKLRITSHTGHKERTVALSKLTDIQLLSLHNVLVDECMKKWINNERHLFEAVDFIIINRKINIIMTCQWSVTPGIQTFAYNALSGNSESRNPDQKLYHLSVK